jgi:glycosyltransferase involved in cell wall biosynthesis
MRIAIICGAGIVSGKEIMALELANGLRDEGRCVEVVTSAWGNREFYRRCVVFGFPVHTMRLGFISASLNLSCVRMTAHQMMYWPNLLARYRRFLRTFEPHKVIQTNWHHALLLWPLLKPGRDVFWIHEIIPDKPQYRRVLGRMAQRLQSFVAISHAVSDSLRRIGIPKEKICVVCNGIKDPLSEFAAAMHEPDRLVIGIVGQIGSWKGHEDMIEALSLVVPSFPTVRLHVFGQGDPQYEEFLKQKGLSLGIADRIVWRGFVANRAQIYQGMDICVVPSRFEEPLGLVAIEASFFGLPVIASRRGGLSEIVEDGLTGFLVEANRPNELASRLRLLLDDEKLRKDMGVRARCRAKTNFGDERFIREFAHVLDDRV